MSVLLLGNERSLLMGGRVSVLDPDTSSMLVVMLLFSLYNFVVAGGCPGWRKGQKCCRDP